MFLSAAYTYPQISRTRADSVDSRNAGSNPSSSVYGGDSRRSSIPVHLRYAHEQTVSHAPQHSASSVEFTSHYSPAQRLSALSDMNGTKEPPEMKLELNGVQRTLTEESISSTDSRGPKSPGAGRLGTFFGWKGSSPKGDSPSTAFSDRSISPQPLGEFQRKQSLTPMDAQSPKGLTPSRLDIQKANARKEYFDNPETPLLLGSGETNAHVRELERELAHVSEELASSVKREMELEDELDRVKIEIPNGATSSDKRTSDYFSDSGASSTRFPIGDVDAKLEQLETKVRKVEQEKAQAKIEMASRLQTELSRRRDLEEMVHRMEQQLQGKFDEEDQQHDLEERVDELESALEDSKRRLKQEKEHKSNFEDLYNATRGELERHKNEHDNLRDEVVPQLKARLEGLEAEASDSQAIIYDNTRMQQEIAAMKGKMHGRFGSIAEEHVDLTSPPLGGPRGLSRTSSLARSQSKRGGSLTRSGSVKDRSDGGRHRSGSLNGDAVREIEDQRDALHKALKLLITRCDKQQREHERAIKKLTKAKTRAEEFTPAKGVYHREVAFLKEEVATLRKRTEDALESKWEYEKGLSGLKMDLDRAELETRGLRIILQENDILAPSTRTQLSDGQASNEAADDKIKLSISTAESERDQAKQIAAQYRARAEEVDGSRVTELMNSAKRMDELAEQLDKQVQSNVQLRSRLANAVAKGEREQRESNGRIAEMQKRLTVMEDSVLAAQQHSETTLGNHEAEVRRLEEASSPALQRLTISVPDNRKLVPGSPMLAKSPKLGSKKLSETSLLEMSRTQMLERKVKEMEGLLREAEEDMQQVVQTVNKSQMEVAELQTERDAALSQMHKLQALIVEEREKAEGLMR